MADALASGASVRKDVGVQVPPRPPNRVTNPTTAERVLVVAVRLGVAAKAPHRDAAVGDVAPFRGWLDSSQIVGCW